MSARVKTALVLGPVCLAVVFLGGSLLFGAVVALAAAVGVYEYNRMMSPDGEPLEVAFSSAWGAVIALGFLAGSPAVPGALLAVGTLLYLGAWIVGRGPSPDTTGRWGRVVGGWVLVAYFLGHAVWVREWGISPVLFILGVVWVGDTAAYYVGSALGTHPLAPAVSPKKSVEGAVASLVAGAGCAAVLGIATPLPHSEWTSVLLGVILNGAAQVGDLAESLLKRCAGVKDSGTLFPGHGGVLDRIDGFLFSLPLYAAVLRALSGG